MENQSKLDKEKGFARIISILEKNRLRLAQGTIVVFIAIGLLALSPAAIPAAVVAAIPGGLTALGINIVSEVLIKAANKNELTEDEIILEIQNIIDNKGILSQAEFISYMSPYYPKLLEIQEKVENLSTISEIRDSLENALVNVMEKVINIEAGVEKINETTKKITLDVEEIKKNMDGLITEVSSTDFYASKNSSSPKQLKSIKQIENTSEKTKILLANDSAIERSGLKEILETDDRFFVIGEAETAIEIPSLVDLLNPDLLIVDLKFQGDETAGIEAISAVRRNNIILKIIAITAHDHLIFAAKKSGADVAVSVIIPSDQLLTIIDNLTKK